jgi:hypothetical protein
MWWCFRFEFSIPDRNRLIPDRIIPFPISRNIGFVFPSGVPVPISVPDKKNMVAGMVKGFSRPFPTVFIPRYWYSK